MTYIHLDRHQALYFRDQLREARATALGDAEGSGAVYMCLERLGSFLAPDQRGLYSYGEAIKALATSSPLANEIPRGLPEFHAPFPVMYDAVRLARNDAVHEGAAARHMTANAVALALVLEDALVDDSCTLRDFMVSDPICAHLWEPISFLRQKMLLNSFSFLPVRTDSSTDAPWELVSDRGLVQYVRPPNGQDLSNSQRRERLAARLSEAIEEGDLGLEPAIIFPPETPVHEAARELDHRPALVVDTEVRLLGIVTAFDLL